MTMTMYTMRDERTSNRYIISQFLSIIISNKNGEPDYTASNHIYL